MEHKPNAATEGKKRWKRHALPLYGPDSMMPSVVDAKLLGVSQDSERFRAPGTLG